MIRTTNNKIILTRSRQERRTQNSDTQKAGLVRDKTPTNRRDRLGRGNGNDRTITHAGQDRLRQDIEKRLARTDSQRKGIFTGQHRTGWTGHTDAGHIYTGWTHARRSKTKALFRQ
jgi:hypothetical protein